MAKIGRNEPCPCGSGRKYKRCCADSERIEKRREQELPVVWRYLCAETGDAELARGALVSGAVVATILERGPLDFEAVEVLEYATDRDRSDYADILAIVWRLRSRLPLDDAPVASAHLRAFRSGTPPFNYENYGVTSV